MAFSNHNFGQPPGSSGASNPPTFGTSGSSGSIFGNKANQSSNPFPTQGNTPFPTASAPPNEQKTLFGAATDKPTINPFGSTPTTTTSSSYKFPTSSATPSMFNTTPKAAPSTQSMFGSNTPAPPTSGPPFGLNPSTTPAGLPPSQSILGASTGGFGGGLGGASNLFGPKSAENNQPFNWANTPASAPSSQPTSLPSTTAPSSTLGTVWNFGQKTNDPQSQSSQPSSTTAPKFPLSFPSTTPAANGTTKPLFNPSSETTKPLFTAPTSSQPPAPPTSSFYKSPAVESPNDTVPKTASFPPLSSQPTTSSAAPTTSEPSKSLFSGGLGAAPPLGGFGKSPSTAAQSTPPPSLFPSLGKPTSTIAPSTSTAPTTTTASLFPGLGKPTSSAAPSTSTAPTTTAPATTAVFPSFAPTTNAAPGASTSADPKLNASTAGPIPPAQSRLKNKTMDEILTRWATDLTKYTKEFKAHSETVAKWDQTIVDNTSKIDKLYIKTRTCERQTMSVEMQLSAVESQQAELEMWLSRYENDVDEMLAKDPTNPADVGGPDKEREHTYKLAEKLQERLDDMGRDLESMVEEVNAANASLSKNGKANEPITQIVAILNAHLLQLQAIDQGTATLREKVAEAQKSASKIDYQAGSTNEANAAVDDFYRTFMGRR